MLGILKMMHNNETQMNRKFVYKTYKFQADIFFSLPRHQFIEESIKLLRTFSIFLKHFSTKNGTLTQRKERFFGFKWKERREEKNRSEKKWKKATHTRYLNTFFPRMRGYGKKQKLKIRKSAFQNRKNFFVWFYPSVYKHFFILFHLTIK